MNNATRLYQDLEAVFLPNRKYTLSVLVGTRKSVPFGLPKVRLKSGDTLAAEALPTAPPQGEFAPFSMQFRTPASGGVVGLPIRIEFQGLGGDAQWWLDNVRLVASGGGSVTNPPPPPPVYLAEYDMSAGYPGATNPDGPWSLGWTETLNGPFTLLGFRKSFASENGVAILDWQVSDNELPGVAKVVGAGTAISVGGAFTAPSGTVYATPGTDGTSRNFGTIRFTVPANESGVYRIETEVKPVYDGPLSADSDFHIVRNGQELYGVFLPPNTPGGHTNQIELRAGDTVDFVTGRGADGLHADRTALKIRAWLGKVSASTNPPPPPPAGLVRNGSFELGVNPGISADVTAPNSSTIAGWTVESASVDYIGSRWIAGDGVRCLDLSGTDAGTISQVISGLTPGQSYRLSFLMAANPEVGTYTARLRATIANANQEFTFLQPGITTANLGWTEKSLEFTASASTHKLTFVSLNPGWAGAALDKVAIEPGTTEPPGDIVQLPIVNHSFENPVLPDGQYNINNIPGWVGEGSWFHVANPADYWFNRTSQNSSGPNPIDGLNIAGMNVSTRLYQDIGAAFLPSHAYTLSLLVGTRKGVPFGTPSIRLKRGNEIVAETLPGAPAPGEFAPVSLTYVTPASGGPVGSPIRIEIQGAGIDAQVWIDNIRLSARPDNSNTNPPPPAGMVFNGSFELGVNPGISSDVPGPDSTTITGWTVENASVDYIGTRWIAGDGVRCLDISGTDAATISQTISGLTPGQAYKLKFLMAANPEVGTFTARLRAAVGGTGREFSFVQSGYTTANLGWQQKTLHFRASAASEKLSFTSLNPGWAGAALDAISIEIDLNPPPSNHAPIARALVSPLFTVWPDQEVKMVIAVDGLAADVVLDGALSTDEDGDALGFFWTKDAEGVPFASGVLTTNSLDAGLHQVVLLVDDGQASGADTLEIEVITLESAIDEIHAAINESELPRNAKRPLFATLDRVRDSVVDGRLELAVRQLRAFERKVRAQLAGEYSELGDRLKNAAHQVSDAIASHLESREDKDDKKK